MHLARRHEIRLHLEWTAITAMKPIMHKLRMLLDRFADARSPGSTAFIPKSALEVGINWGLKM
jgi:hypothetical protein